VLKWRCTLLNRRPYLIHAYPRTVLSDSIRFGKWGEKGKGRKRKGQNVVCGVVNHFYGERLWPPLNLASGRSKPEGGKREKEKKRGTCPPARSHGVDASTGSEAGARARFPFVSVLVQRGGGGKKGKSGASARGEASFERRLITRPLLILGNRLVERDQR